MSNQSIGKLRIKPDSLLLAAAFYCLLGGSAFPCTTFVLEGGHRIFLAKNLDWDWEEGRIFINPQHLQKTAIVANSASAAKWTSRYGSVTFNQFEREMPFGGMNEAGLAIESMWLDGTVYPDPDARPEVNMLQWIQYQLDNCSTVSEVLASDRIIRLEHTPVRARIHYLVCDAGGDCAAIEFLNGRMVVHRGKALPHAMANDTYASELAYLDAHPQHADSEPFLQTDSLSRFCRAATRAADFKPASSSAKDVAYAFETLDQVHQGTATVWQIVYDVSERRIHWRTRSKRQVCQLDLKTLSFTSGRPTRFTDIQSNPSSSGAFEFEDWTEAGQREYLEHFFGQESLKREVGDVTWMIQPALLLLRTYTVAQ